SSALPDAAGNQLEWPSCNLRPRGRDADDDRHPPAFVAALQCLAHQLHVADTFEAIVRAALGEVDEVRDQLVLCHVVGIHEMRHAEFLGQRAALRIDVDADDHVGAGHARTLDHVQTDTTEAEYDDICSGFHLRGVDHRANTGGHAATDVADLVKWRVFANPG